MSEDNPCNSTEILKHDPDVNVWLTFTMSKGLVDTLYTYSNAAEMNSVLIDEGKNLFKV